MADSDESRLADLDLLQTGQGLHQRKLRGDLKRELINLLENQDAQNRGIRWADLAKALEEQSSVTVEAAEFSEVVKLLESEGQVKVSGERDRRLIKRTTV